MKIEVLHVADCPSHPATVKRLQEVLETCGVAAEIQEVLVTDLGMADQLQFPGSPTIRINGRDVAGEASEGRTFAMSCRLYTGAQPTGLPPVEMIRRAVIEARMGEQK